MLKNFFKRNSEKKSGVPILGSYIHTVSNVFGASQSTEEFISYYLESSPVFTAVKLIRDNVSSIDYALKDNKKEEFVTSHPLLDLLNNPNPFVNGKLFLGEIASYFMLTGNNYMNIIGSSKPVELHILRPQSMTVEPNNRDGYPQIYNFNNSVGSEIYKRDKSNRFFSGNKNELTHLRNFNPNYSNNNLIGVSELVACEIEISQYLLASIHNNSLLKNQATPSGILTYKGKDDISQETIDQVKSAINTKLSGADNAGKATFLSGDFDWKQLSESVKDMDFATLKKQTAEAVYNALKIPLPMVSPDNMTLANMETAKLNFYDNTILPLAKTIFKYLGDSLLSRYPDGENLELTFDEAAIEALQPRMVDNTLKLSSSGVLTVNEIRSQLGYEDLEGGNTLYQPMNLVPIASDNFTSDNRQTPSDKSDERAQFIELMTRQKTLEGKRLYSDQDVKQLLQEYYNN